jgi:hypothetical protein
MPDLRLANLLPGPDSTVRITPRPREVGGTSTRKRSMTVTTDADYLSARAANFAAYERERDLALQREERGEYKQGEFERARDALRYEYAVAMSRAYAEFLAREARQQAAG